MSDYGLHELLRQSLAGDYASRESAFARLVDLIAVFVRSKMGNQLRTHRESMDVSQSIAMSFFVNHQLGNLQFPSEAAVVGYLRTVVQTKLASLARRDSAQKRSGKPTAAADWVADDGERIEPFLGLKSVFPLEEVAVNDEPDARLRFGEATRLLESRLSARDLTIAKRRMEGADWNTIGEELECNPQALRKYWSRLAANLQSELCGTDDGGETAISGDAGLV